MGELTIRYNFVVSVEMVVGWRALISVLAMCRCVRAGVWFCVYRYRVCSSLSVVGLVLLIGIVVCSSLSLFKQEV